MVAERRFFDLEDDDRLDEVVREVEREHAPIELRRGGKVVAVVMPSPSPAELPRGAMPGDLRAFVGALKNELPDDFAETNAAARRIPSRVFDWE